MPACRSPLFSLAALASGPCSFQWVMRPDLSNRSLGGSKDKTCQHFTQGNGKNVSDTVIMLLPVVYGIFKLWSETHRVTALPEDRGSLPPLPVGGEQACLLVLSSQLEVLPRSHVRTAVSEETPTCFTNLSMRPWALKSCTTAACHRLRSQIRLL